MDDATKKMVTTLGATAIKNTLMSLGPVLAAHGVIASNQTETFVSSGMFLVGILWSFWDSYGRAIFLAKMEVWKAKSLAQAAALHANGIPPVTNVEIAAHGPEALTPATVAKVAATLCLLLAFGLMAGPAIAQVKRPLPLTGNIVNDIRQRTDSTDGVSGGGSGGLRDIMSAFDSQAKSDLEFALAIAKKSGNQQTAACWQAWLDQIAARQNANVDAQGNPLTPPDPHIITDFQKIMDLRNALQPNAPFFQACTPIAVTIKMDIVKFIGMIMSGGAGLMALVPGL